ncbi:hypothetical protein ACQUSR_11140 [Streptomyces sp. P1-3]|uniref:hypothetical protein n=1 Tax=Streptomyces sp. P1-3 TaxID=3421658 RepID=UPI003D36C5ED
MVTVIVLILSGVCFFTYAIYSLEKSLKGNGGVEGSAENPLGAGDTERYENGLRVTVSEPRLEPDGTTHRFTVTYENESDRTLTALPMGAGRVPLVVNDGEPLDHDDPDDSSSSYTIDLEETVRKLLTRLDAGDSITVPVRVVGSKEGMTITVKVWMPFEGYRYDHPVYWTLTLD